MLKKARRTHYLISKEASSLNKEALSTNHFELGDISSVIPFILINNSNCPDKEFSGDTTLDRVLKTNFRKQVK